MRKYRTISGDMWDLIAYKVYKNYGGENLVSVLLQANTKYLTTAIFSAGIELDIPEVYHRASKTLPPWMKN